MSLRCPACGSEMGELPQPGLCEPECCQCHYRIRWRGDCWDALSDQTYPRDFAKQWVLWEAGKLGDPNRVYGNDPIEYFNGLLRALSLTPQQLGSMRILEIGFGHGRVLQAIQKYCPNAYGLDLSRPLASARLRPGSAIFGNLLQNPFASRQFDLVICRGVVHVTPDPKSSFAHVAEQVADNGLLFVGGLYEPGKGNLILRRVFPGSWTYPEPVLLGLASAFGAVRSGLECARSHSVNWASFKRFYNHYKLDIFDIMCPKWTYEVAEDQVSGWFRELKFSGQRVGYGDYVGSRIQ